MIKANIGKYDKVIRTIIGLCIIVVGVMFESILGAIGIVFLVSAYLSFCPIYKIFGIKTNKNNEDSCGCGGSNCGCH